MVSRARTLSEALSPSKDVDGIISLGPIKAATTLTKTFSQDESYELDLLASIDGVPNVSVFKEIPQIGLSSKWSWDVNSTASNYDFYNEATTVYAGVNITPSNSTGDGTFALSAGSFSSGDVGKKVLGNGGEAIITDVNGAYTLISSFNDTSTITSGNWALYGLSGNDNGISIISNSQINGYDLTSAIYDNISFSVTGQSDAPAGIFFNNDGSKMYITGTTSDSVHQYSLSTEFDLSTASYDSVSFSVSNETTAPCGVAFNGNGSKMYVLGIFSQGIHQYSLSTGFDLSTASYDSVSFVPTGAAGPEDIAFNDDGTKMYIVGSTGDSVYQYSLSTGFDLSTASYDSVSFSVSGQDAAPRGVSFSHDGVKMFIAGRISGAVYQYSLSTGFDLSTASYDSVSFSVSGQDTIPTSIIFNVTGNKMYIVGDDTNSVYQYTTGSSTILYPSSQYIPAITNSIGRINTTSWLDINDMTPDETLNDGEIHYAISTDARSTWKIFKNGEGERSIVRNNSGTWQYNTAIEGMTNETWVNSTYNNEHAALQQSLSVSINRMNSTQLSDLSDVNEPTLGNSLDLMIAPYISSGTTVPKSDGVTINYDAESLIRQGIAGTDYNVEFPNISKVKIVSLSNQNLRIKVL